MGGCCIIEGASDYYCKDCESEWTRQQAIDHAYGKVKALRTSVGGYFGGYYNVKIDLIRRRLHGATGALAMKNQFRKLYDLVQQKNFLKN